VTASTIAISVRGRASASQRPFGETPARRQRPGKIQAETARPLPSCQRARAVSAPDGAAVWNQKPSPEARPGGNPKATFFVRVS
jgi:hypothetical protein